MFFWLRRPHALLENVFEIKFKVELQILWLLLQPSVIFLLPGPAFEDERIEAKEAIIFFISLVAWVARSEGQAMGVGVCTQ